MKGVANYVYRQKDHHDQMVAPQQVNPWQSRELQQVFPQKMI